MPKAPFWKLVEKIFRQSTWIIQKTGFGEKIWKIGPFQKFMNTPPELPRKWAFKKPNFAKHSISRFFGLNTRYIAIFSKRLGFETFLRRQRRRHRKFIRGGLGCTLCAQGGEVRLQFRFWKVSKITLTKCLELQNSHQFLVSDIASAWNWREYYYHTLYLFLILWNQGQMLELWYLK